VAKILVVDDEQDIVRGVVKIMESCGHQVTTARDGAEALAMVGKSRPDLVILDLNIPKIHGRDVCRTLRSDPKTRDLPIVMMTSSYISLEDAGRSAEPGADEYVVKPFLRELLIHNVERLLARAA